MNRLCAAALLALTLLAAPAAAQQTPQAAYEELIRAERALSAAAANLSPAEGIAGMLADDVVLMSPQGPIRGRAAATANLRANPANAGTHASWRSIRGGVSADGQHGFTLGYLDIAGGDPARARRRYLAYWVRGAEGWRAATLRQALRSANEVEATAQPPALPAAIVAPQPERRAAFAESLVAAEQAFSDRAQRVGIRQAFQENGRPDAIHLGAGTNSFVVGLAAIGAVQAAQGGPTDSSPVNWSADSAIVASSGDLGVTIGTIRVNGTVPEGQPGAFPFFTIWRRDSPDRPWRYIAE